MKSRGYTLMETMVALGLMLIVGLGVAQMVRGANEGASRSVKQAKQNAELRNAMDTLQSSVGNADRPLLDSGTISTMADGKVGSNQLVYTRTEDFGSGSSYLVERIYFQQKSVSTDGTQTGNVILQRKSFSSDSVRSCAIGSASGGSSCGSTAPQSLSSPSASNSGWSTAPTKILVTNAQLPTGKTLFSYSARAGIPATVVSGKLTDVSLVDINLRRDEDPTGSDYKPATLATTVYLRKIGSNKPGSGAIGC